MGVVTIGGRKLAIAIAVATAPSKGSHATGTSNDTGAAWDLRNACVAS
jgi:hypothetical protein